MLGLGSGASFSTTSHYTIDSIRSVHVFSSILQWWMMDSILETSKNRFPWVSKFLNVATEPRHHMMLSPTLWTHFSCFRFIYFQQSSTIGTSWKNSKRKPRLMRFSQRTHGPQTSHPDDSSSSNRWFFFFFFFYKDLFSSKTYFLQPSDSSSATRWFFLSTRGFVNPE